MVQCRKKGGGRAEMATGRGMGGLWAGHGGVLVPDVCNV